MLGPVSIVLVAIVVAGCVGGNPVGAAPVATAVADNPMRDGEEAKTVLELRFDQTTTHEDLELRWLELDDSRCPIGVTCIWEGEVKVRLEVARGEEDPVELELTLRAGHEPQAGMAYGHALRLLGVDPHPKKGRTPARGDYVARVEIEAA